MLTWLSLGGNNIGVLAGALMPTINLFIVMRLVSGVGIGATVPVLFILIPEVVAPTCREAYVTAWTSRCLSAILLLQRALFVVRYLLMFELILTPK